MKLLLTSGGIYNKAIGTALQEMVGKSVSEVKVGHIPMAANPEGNNKDWFIQQFVSLWRYGFNWIDIIDPSAAGVDWRARLAEVDVVFMSGGNTFHLLDQARKTGFGDWLRENIDKKVYVGGSASTVLMTPDITIAGLPGFEDKNLPGLTDLTGLKFVDFEISPHSEAAMQESMKTYAETARNPVYAIDDNTAIRVIDGKVTVISRGSWKLYE